MARKIARTADAVHQLAAHDVSAVHIPEHVHLDRRIHGNDARAADRFGAVRDLLRASPALSLQCRQRPVELAGIPAESCRPPTDPPETRPHCAQCARLEAIRAVHRGQKRIPPEVVAELTMDTAEDQLTERELEVLKLIAKGNANKEIAAQLSVREDTVKSHVGHILEQLGANDRTHAVTIGIKRGTIDL